MSECNEVVPIINVTNINKDTPQGKSTLRLHYTISYALAYVEITYF
jgi:hypothetical protein